jgi:IS5 family transposase
MTASTDDFYRNRLDQLIDLRHPLAVLANRMPWQEIEASLAHRFARQVRAGKRTEDLGLFGPTVSVAGAGVSNAGRPRLPASSNACVKLSSVKAPSWAACTVMFRAR